ncbi:UNVERIFIED_CONTAM: hypothetical protein FKN15_011290 [Acipenser sinensis]
MGSVPASNSTDWSEQQKGADTTCGSVVRGDDVRCKKEACTAEERELIQSVHTQMKERQNVFFDMEAYLPKKNGLYLNLVLGNVNVTLLSNQAKFAYKDEYEKFKLYMTIILLLGAITCRFFLNYRVIDEIFNFMLVWYYCTLTIRESILISNGSRPNGFIYKMFRNQFLAFSIYQSFVQFLQYYYQSGCLYRLRALGERNHLDLTVEGFQSWMWRGLTFLLPFLFFGHVSTVLDITCLCCPLHCIAFPSSISVQ